MAKTSKQGQKLPSTDDLKRVMNGVVEDVFRADQSIALIEALADQANTLNKEGFGDLAGRLQGYLAEHVVLAVSRIYERSSQFDLKSLPAAIDLMQKGNITADPRHLRMRLAKLGLNEADIEDIDDGDLDERLRAEFRRMLPSAKSARSPMKRLRTMRNKEIAHREDVVVDKIDRTTWGELEALLDNAKCMVAAIEEPYLQIFCEDSDGNYLLTSDARRASRSLRRLFRTAKLID